MGKLLLLFVVMIATYPGAAGARTYERDASAAAGVERKFFRTELYFGKNMPMGRKVNEAEWLEFVDEIITPRFPDGLTILDAAGQWRGRDGSISREETKVLILLYPRKARRAVNLKIEEIRSEYKKRFQQESVMRIDITRSVSVSF